MAEENAVSTPENVEISDEQVEQFFDNGGELPAETPKNDEPEPVAPEPEPEKEKYVPHGAFHEERQRRKELQAELERVRHENAQTAQVMQQVLQQLRQQQSPIPDIQEDPVTNIDTRLRQIEEFRQQQAREQQERAQIEQQQAQAAQLTHAYRAAAQEYAAQVPDLGEAYRHLIGSRVSEYQALGYDTQSAHALVQQEEMQIAAKAFHDGVNPAQRIYELAKLRGYAKQQAPQEQKMETLQRGTRASRATGGAPQTGEITLEALAEAADSLSPDEFNKLWSQYAKNAN